MVAKWQHLYSLLCLTPDDFRFTYNRPDRPNRPNRVKKCASDRNDSSASLFTYDRTWSHASSISHGHSWTRDVYSRLAVHFGTYFDRPNRPNRLAMFTYDRTDRPWLFLDRTDRPDRAVFYRGDRWRSRSPRSSGSSHNLKRVFTYNRTDRPRTISSDSCDRGDYMWTLTNLMKCQFYYQY